MARLAIGLALGLATFCPAIAAEPPEVTKAQVKVADMMKDPWSARFKDVVLYSHKKNSAPPIKVVCGLVNSKNSYGAYTGFKQFVYMPNHDAAYVVETGVDYQLRTALSLIRQYCRPAM